MLIANASKKENPFVNQVKRLFISSVQEFLIDLLSFKIYEETGYYDSKERMYTKVRVSNSHT